MSSRLPARHLPAIVLAALAAGGVAIALALGSDHQEAKVAWAIFGPVVGWSFAGVGVYTWRYRDETRIGALMVLLAGGWFLFTLGAADSRLLYTASLIVGGLWGGVFLHLGLAFPTGYLTTTLDRALAIAGYGIFQLAFVPSMFFGGPSDLGCDNCPTNLLLVERDDDLMRVATVFGALLYLVLFVIVLARSVQRWRASSPFGRLQLTPVYVCALLTFLLVTIARGGAGDAAWWSAFISTGLMPFAFLGGLLRSHVSHLDAELRESLEELRASRARIVSAGDAERRRLERDLHDGAQSRLVALSLLLRAALTRAEPQSQLASMLERAQEELQTSLSELRELARGIHPAVLTDRGLEPALQALALRAPVPVTVEAGPEDEDRLPGQVETAAYFVVSEALTNVAKYAHASHATVAVRRDNDHVTVEVIDDGIGGADATRGTGLRGLADRLSALDGTLSLDSAPGRGTRLHAEIPVEPTD